ncbi:MAG: PD-(D/E)XK nuclease family protein, partial [Planctomycetota bacterium]|nr:PD-(D/E)XK nuclease family protein [Planctomycetota bacterium]
DAQVIEAFLFETMHNLARETFGSSPMPSIRVQLARLEQRLAGFARCQANLREEGWSIRHCEMKFTTDNTLDIPDQPPMPIVGKIDRIDQHDDGRWRIIDYKTGDGARSPHQVHVGKLKFNEEEELEWQDLQLPLYRHLADRIGVRGEVELGYLVLPKQADGVKFIPANWSEPQYEAALELARDVVQDIREGNFDLNTSYQASYDNFDRICQTTAFTMNDDDAQGDSGASS